jgi:hypothetical protein
MSFIGRFIGRFYWTLLLGAFIGPFYGAVLRGARRAFMARFKTNIQRERAAKSRPGKAALACLAVLIFYCFFYYVSVISLAPRAGLEPATCGLTVRRSTD